MRIATRNNHAQGASPACYLGLPLVFLLVFFLAFFCFGRGTLEGVVSASICVGAWGLDSDIALTYLLHTDITALFYSERRGITPITK